MQKVTNLAIYLAIALWFFSNFGGKIDDSSKAPFPTDKFNLLIVEEAQERYKLPAAQQELLGGTAWRAEIPEDQRRVLDEETVITEKEDPWVKEAWKVKRDSVPWLVISNGKTGYSGPLVADEKTLIEFINKYEAN